MLIIVCARAAIGTIKAETAIRLMAKRWLRLRIVIFDINTKADTQLSLGALLTLLYPLLPNAQQGGVDKK